MNHHTPLNRRHLLTLAASAAASALGACGGGGGSAAASGSTSTTAAANNGIGGTGSTAGVGTGGTGTGATNSVYVLGAISGFGSIIVNGVRYDDSSARVTDDNGGQRGSSDLKLGMTVEIRAGATTVGADGVSRSTASSVQFNRSLTGPVSAINATAGTLVVFGQTIVVTSTTVFDNVAGLAGLVVNDVVEVYALTDSEGRRVATRIERKTASAFDGMLVLTGAIASLNAARTEFKLGAVTVTLGSALASTLGNGSEVRVVARATSTPNLVVAQTVTARSSLSSSLEGASSACVEGFVTAFTSASSFSVNGLPVVTTAATRVEGTSTAIALGARIEVEGTVTNGVLTATKVKVKVEDDSGNGSSGSSSGGSSGSSSGGSGNGSSASANADAAPFELHGGITAVNAAARTFVLRGLTISYDATTEFRKGAADLLVVGRQVEVKGVRAADGVSLKALRITFES